MKFNIEHLNTNLGTVLKVARDWVSVLTGKIQGEANLSREEITRTNDMFKMRHIGIFQQGQGLKIC